MGNYILWMSLFIFWGLALFIPIFIYNLLKKRSNIPYFILFIVDALLLLFVFGDFDIEGSEIGKNITYAYSLFYQFLLTVLTFFFLLIHLLIRKFKRKPSFKKSELTSTNHSFSSEEPSE